MSGSSESSAEPNLTPMLDMVFQLITFFMLVMNVKAAALDQTLKLPIVGSARPVDTKGQEELLILNVSSEGKLNVYGIPHEVAHYIAGEAELSRQYAKGSKGVTIKPGEELPTIVVIRTDRDTRFSSLNKVIKSCQEQGFRKFALRALDREATK